MNDWFPHGFSLKRLIIGGLNVALLLLCALAFMIFCEVLYAEKNAFPEHYAAFRRRWPSFPEHAFSPTPARLEPEAPEKMQ